MQLKDLRETDSGKPSIAEIDRLITELAAAHDRLVEELKQAKISHVNALLNDEHKDTLVVAEDRIKDLEREILRVSHKRQALNCQRDEAEREALAKKSAARLASDRKELARGKALVDECDELAVQLAAKLAALSDVNSKIVEGNTLRADEARKHKTPVSPFDEPGPENRKQPLKLPLPAAALAEERGLVNVNDPVSSTVLPNVNQSGLRFYWRNGRPEKAQS